MTIINLATLPKNSRRINRGGFCCRDDIDTTMTDIAVEIANNTVHEAINFSGNIKSYHPLITEFIHVVVDGINVISVNHNSTSYILHEHWNP